MFGKLIENRLIVAPPVIDTEEAHIYNPSHEVLRAAGYKLVIMAGRPATDPGFHAESRWEDREDGILQEWVIVEDPGDLDQGELLEILLGGDGV